MLSSGKIAATGQPIAVILMSSVLNVLQNR
jgi:hypothetical protein